MNAGKHKVRSIALMAWKEGGKHLPGVMGTVALCLLVRAAVWLPLILDGLFPGMAEHIPLPGWSWIAWMALVYVFGVIPMRCWAGERFRHYSGGHQVLTSENAYGKWLRTGLTRYFRGILWSLPFLLCVGYFVYGFKNLPFNKMWQPIQQLAGLIGREPSIETGIIIFVCAAVLFALLSAWGWWRDMPVEYLHVRFSRVRKTFRLARKVMKSDRRRIRANTAVNFLLSLPAWLGCLLVIVPYVKTNVFYSSNPQIVFTSLVRLTQKALPAQQLAGLGLVFFVLYLPFCVFRKLRNAVVVRRISRRLSDEGDDHAAG